MSPRTRGCLVNLLVLAGTLLLLGVGLEVAARLLLSGAGDWYAAGPQRLAFLRDHVRRNADGFRDREFGPRGAGTARVLAVGDSFTFGDGIERIEATWPRVLEAELARRGLACEVLNLGVPGTNTAYQRDLLRRDLPRLRPDGVVLGFVLNDPEPPGANRAAVPQRLYLPLLPLPRLDAALTRGLHAYAWARGAKNRLLERAGRKETYADYVASLYRPGPGWAAWEHDARELVSLVRARGGFVVVAVFPLFADFERHAFRQEAGRAAAVFRSAGAQVVDLFPAFAGSPARELSVSPTDAHPNERAHAIAARTMAPQVATALAGGSEHRVDEGRERAAGGEHDHEAEQHQHEHDGQQPVLLALPQELPDLADDGDPAHPGPPLSTASRSGPPTAPSPAG